MINDELKAVLNSTIDITPSNIDIIISEMDKRGKIDFKILKDLFIVVAKYLMETDTESSASSIKSEFLSEEINLIKSHLDELGTGFGNRIQNTEIGLRGLSERLMEMKLEARKAPEDPKPTL